MNNGTACYFEGAAMLGNDIRQCQYYSFSTQSSSQTSIDLDFRGHEFSHPMAAVYRVKPLLGSKKTPYAKHEGEKAAD